MKNRSLLGLTLGAALLLGAGAAQAGVTILAQATVPPGNGTSLGSPSTQPQPGGGTAVGPGAPTSAVPNVQPDPLQASPRGAPVPGSTGAATNGGVASGGPGLTPGGSVTPGNPSLDGRSGGG